MCASGSATADSNQHQNKTGTTLYQQYSTETKHSSLGVNNTLWRRVMILSAIRLLDRVRPSVGHVLFLTDKLCVKIGAFSPLSEASTLQFVAQHTSIPVPKVHCAFRHKDCTYILMDRIHGEMVAIGWTSRSAESKGKILQQLKGMIQELRSLPPPGPSISGADGGPVYDVRFPGTSKTIGPFKTIHDFHLFLRNGIHKGPTKYPEIDRMIALQDRPWPLPVFTHGDLSSLNILVRGDNVVGIVDWETSGWYPTYWEHSMAWYVNPRNTFWKEEVGKFLESTPEDMEMESARLMYFGDV